MPNWSGCLTEANSIPCQRCTAKTSVQLFYYIDASVMVDFDKRLRSASNDFACVGCGHVFQVRAPLLLDIPMRNLLVFVTHRGDDGGVDNGFRMFLERMSSLLPSSVAERARTTPYTFVHGFRGLFALLDAFQGMDRRTYRHDRSGDGQEYR